MKPQKLLVGLAAAVCALAVSNARAIAVVGTPGLTNVVTINLVAESQGASSIVDVTNTVFAKPNRAMHNTAQILQELGGVTVGGAGFSKAAKLVYIKGGSGPTGFAVIDGATFVSVSNIMTLNTKVSTNEVMSGEQTDTTGLGFKTISTISIVELNYDDTVVGGSLSFNLQGIATATTTDTLPSSTRTYTETFSAKITGTGSGQSIGAFILTGTVNFSGSGQLVLPLPT